MARSMTAYGRAHAKTTAGTFLIEIHSVNRKSLDINSNLPKELLPLDMDFRKRLSDDVKRGMITIRISKESGNTSSTEMPSLDSMKGLHKEWSNYAQELGYDPKQAIPFVMLLQYAGTGNHVFFLSEALKKELIQGFDQALKEFMAMKEVEGKALLTDIFPRLRKILEQTELVELLAKEAPERYRERLEKRLEELKLTIDGDSDRIAREIVLYADRIDVTEELIRLRSHIEQFEAIVQKEQRRVGRELDFLTQEMNRELNTIAAKSQELGITQAILEGKSELEKIREQLQNIE